MKKIAECLYLNEPSKTYYALVKRSGKQIRRSLKTQDRKLAERRLLEFRKNVGKLTGNAEDRKLDFGTLSKRWLNITNAPLKPSSADRNVRCVKSIESSFRGKTISSITRGDCEDWIAIRSKEVAGRTSNYELQVLKRIFQYAVDTGIILNNPAITIKPRKERKKAILVPGRKEFEALIAMLGTMAKRDARTRHAVHLVKLLAFSGMRLGEATRIVWGEIDFNAKEPVFTVSGGDVGTKNGETRIVPLFPPLRKFLEGLRADLTGSTGKGIGASSGASGEQTGISEAARAEATGVSTGISGGTPTGVSGGVPTGATGVSGGTPTGATGVSGGVPTGATGVSGGTPTGATGVSDGALTGRIVRIDSAKKALITACETAGLPHFTHHCLRHYFVSNAIEKGIDFKTIAAWVGHKDGGLLVAKTYGHLRDTHSHEMAKLME